MLETFYTLMTAAGLAKLANAQALGTSVDLATLKAGDSGGAYRDPTENDTEVVGEVWSGNVNRIFVDEQNPNWVVVEAVIPTDVGGFYIREVGVFDDAGDLIAVGKYPETYKPTLAAGSGKDLYIRMILEISNAADVELKIDPATVLASRQYVDNRIADHLVDRHRDPLFKSAAYTALAGDNIWVDTSAGEVPITLPAAPEVGDKVFIGDHKGTWGTNACRLKGNGEKIMGQTLGDEALLDATALTGTWEYTGADQGWRI